MPPKPGIEREQVLNAAVELVREEGIHGVNARSLAQAIGCSTKPLFRIYKNMEELREDIKQKLDEIYDEFMSQRMRDENRLLSQSIAYVEFARSEPGIFRGLFLDHTLAGKSLGFIINAPWNQRSIENAGKIAGLSLEGAQGLFINMWLYSHGVASQLISNEIDLPEERVKELMEKAFTSFMRQEKETDNERK